MRNKILVGVISLTGGRIRAIGAEIGTLNDLERRNGRRRAQSLR